MSLSNDLLYQFAKMTSNKKQTNKDKTVYGTIIRQNGASYVKIDGSDILTPISSTADVIDGDRVTVLIKDHQAIVTGNLSSPSATKDSVDDIGTKIAEFEIVIADKVSTIQLEAQVARIDELESINVTITGELEAAMADIQELEAINATITGKLDAAEAEIDNLTATKLDADVADIKFATIESLEAIDADVYNLTSEYGTFKDLVTEKFTANEAVIEEIRSQLINVDDLEVKFANIDFSNIGKAAIEAFFSKSGMIADLVVGDGTITGELVGVTIKGDLIEGNTIVADKLVIKGSDGLFYKLNTNGETVTSSQTEYNSLNGKVITAKTVTAEKIAVNDLVAFDATIGGLNIANNSIYSGVKESVNNTTRGFYVDDDGQVAFGDANNFIKYFKDTDNVYKLRIAAGSIVLSSTNKNIEDSLAETITSSVSEFYQSNSPTELSGGSWSSSQPAWTQGKYIWLRAKVTYGNGNVAYSPNQTGVCITGNTGATGGKGEKGEQGNPGEDGRGVSSTAITYQASTSGTSVPTGVWSSNIPSVPAGQYLWTRTVITYTDKTTSTLYSVGKMGNTGAAGGKGEKGDPGNDGRGVKSTVVTYQAHSSQTSTPTGTWSSTVPQLSTDKPYLWTRTVITYTDDTTSTSYSVSSTLESIEVGGRNLIIGTNKASTDGWYHYGWDGSWTTYSEEERTYEFKTVNGWRVAVYDMTEYVGNDISISCDVCLESKSTNTESIWIASSERSHNTNTGSQKLSGYLTFEEEDIWYHYENHINLTQPFLGFYVRSTVSDAATGTTYVLIKNLKFEKGNKSTDWTPAPEDMATNERVSIAESMIEQLNNSISMIVTDEDGSSMMTQTSNGWTFNISAVENRINQAYETLNYLSGSVEQANNLINNLDSLLDDVSKKTAYINIGTDSSGAPCIELGKSDNPFKVRITNTTIDFIDNFATVAYISNRTLYIESAIVKNELQIGEGTGFIFKRRSNGNLGLRWVG